MELIDHMGDDLAIVNAARVSYAKRSVELTSADKGLIGYLMRERHGTPFEMVVLSFRVWCPIFVAREWQRHRIGSYNEMSSRYVDMPRQAYMPPIEDFRRQVGKPGHYVMEPLNFSEAQAVHALMRTAYERAYKSYELLLAMGLAKEVARNVLPLAQYTEFIWTVNLRSVMNFISLRTAPTALLEIRKLANSVEALCHTVAPVAIDAFRQERLAP